MRSAAKVTIECAGGSGCSVTVPKNKVRSAQYYLCTSKDHRLGCEAKLPPLSPGMMRCVEMNVASHFSGYTDERMNAEAAAGFRRARELLAIGITQMAIEKARKH